MGHGQAVGVALDLWAQVSQPASSRTPVVSFAVARNGAVGYWNCWNACPVRVCSGVVHAWPVLAGSAALGLSRRLMSAA
jgi:hypothetical protein